MTDFEQIFQALCEDQVRFVVVGGVAVVLHGHPRFTADMDIVVSLDPVNAVKVVRALAKLDYRPRAPVAADDFADSAVRRKWIEEKDLTVFTFWSPRLPATEVDLFVSEPFPFDEMWERASKIRIGSAEVAVASVEDLVTMKSTAGRPKDLQDIEELRKIDAQREK